VKLLFLPFLTAFFTILNASAVGYVKDVSGDVKIKRESSLKKSSVEAGLEINSGDLITTASSSTAVLNLLDGSVLALDGSSSLHFGNGSNLNQKEGRIYYKITTRDAANSIKVKTPFAIIGIKGTTFLVNATEDASVKLKEGLIGIKSIKEEFELYRKAIQDEFNDFVAKGESSFEKFKQEQNRGAAELTEEFDLEAGNSVSFFKNIVSEKSFTQDDDAEFSYFEKLINSQE
jgi:hypothetical protein